MASGPVLPNLPPPSSLGSSKEYHSTPVNSTNNDMNSRIAEPTAPENHNSQNSQSNPNSSEIESTSPSSNSPSIRKLSSTSSIGPDAQGSPDDMASPSLSIHNLEDSKSSSGSDHSHQSNFANRKQEVEEVDFIRQNPELYGLRRSSRARPLLDFRESDDENGGKSPSDEDDVVIPHKTRRRPPNKTPKDPSPKLRISSPTPSDSESSSYGRPLSRNARTKNKRSRRISKNGDKSDTSTNLDPVRFSSRRVGKVTTYNEDDDDDEFLVEEEDISGTTSGLQEESSDNSQIIGSVLDHKFNSDVDPENLPQFPTKDQLLYWIKWENQAYIHATWESWSDLVSLKGSKKLRNYYKNLQLRLHEQADPNHSREEEEQKSLAKEREAEALQDYTLVERVIGSRAGDDGLEYYVKWKGLPYDYCTWETVETVSKLAQSQIDRFLTRSARKLHSNRQESSLTTRSPYERFTEQPGYIKNGELRAFQIKGVNFLAHNWCKGNNVILADEMGLGKTVQTVSFMSWLVNARQQEGPFLVVVPLSTIPSWAETFDYWTPDLNYVVYSGNITSRQIIQDFELFPDGDFRKPKFNILLTTYEYVIQDSSYLSQIKWQFLAVDEAHRLKNPKSILYGALIDLAAPSRLLITGTPIQNNLSELSALMNFLMPGKVLVEEDIDLQSEAASQKITELTDQISPYILRRTKQKVENDLPPKTEKIIRVELSDVQLEYYKNILTKNYAALNQGGEGHKQSLLNIMMELKKASNHPFMFPNAESRILSGRTRPDEVLKALITSSGKMMLLDQLLTKLKKDNHRVLIFSQMVRMLDIIGDYLQSRGHQFQRLDGTIPAATRKLAINQFNAPDSKDFAFLLSTRAGGLGINLMTADTVILFDSDWNPQADLQAMARAHRIGQKNPVNVYRFVSKDTVEEEILERARNKLMLEWITIQRGVTDTDVKDIADQRLRKAQEANGTPDSADDINRILKKRGQKMFEQTDNQKKLEELDIDAVLASAEEHNTEQPEGLAADGGEEFLKSFEYTDVKLDLEWDEIIPKEHLEVIKTEEKRKKDEEYLQQIIEQNMPRKRKPPPVDEPEQRAAKRRARQLTKADLSESDDDSEANADPKRPLTTNETRRLIKAHEKFGSIEDRAEDVIKEARLVGRDVETLKAILADVLAVSKRLVQEESDRLDELEKTENKAVTKKDRKAIIFEYKGVGHLNAKTLIERPFEMRLLRDAIATVPDFRSFRIPEASKVTSYTSEWGHREDGMLSVGIVRHGYGAWSAIRDDPELGLGEKLFLEENQVAQKAERLENSDKTVRSPGPVHLVRRVGYLLSVLKDKMSNGVSVVAKKPLQSQPRVVKKPRALTDSGRPSASPAPSMSSKARRDSDSKIRNSSDLSDNVKKHRHPSMNGQRSDAPTAENRESSKNQLEIGTAKMLKKRKIDEGDVLQSAGEKPLKRQNRDASYTKDSFGSKSSADADQVKMPKKRKSDESDLPHFTGEKSFKRQHGDASATRDISGSRPSHANQVKTSHKRATDERGPSAALNEKGAKREGDPEKRTVSSSEIVNQVLRPVAQHCAKLRMSKDLPKEDRVAQMRSAMTAITKQIQSACENKDEKYELECWEVLALRYCTNKITSTKLKTMGETILRSEEAKQKVAAKATEETQPSLSVSETGASAPQPRQHRTSFFQTVFGPNTLPANDNIIYSRPVSRNDSQAHSRPMSRSGSQNQSRPTSRNGSQSHSQPMSRNGSQSHSMSRASSQSGH